MNSITKKIGVAAVVVALVCNLQYSFYSIKESPSAAKAVWTDTNNGNVWCGTSPSTEAYPGTWYYLPTYYGSGNEAYDFYETGYIWYFIRDNGATDCGPNEAPSSYNNYQGYYVTVPRPYFEY